MTLLKKFTTLWEVSTYFSYLNFDIFYEVLDFGGKYVGTYLYYVRGKEVFLHNSITGAVGIFPSLTGLESQRDGETILLPLILGSTIKVKIENIAVSGLYFQIFLLRFEIGVINK